MTKYERIDLEKVDGGVRRRMWPSGWQDGDAPETDEILPGRRLFELMKAAEEKGASVTQFPDGSVQCLSGETTRMDLLTQPDGTVLVNKYPRGWKAHTRPCPPEVWYCDLPQAIANLESGKAWKIRRWVDGARAWKGELLPVRDTAHIQQMRRLYAEKPQRLVELAAGFLTRIDFAFDL